MVNVDIMRWASFIFSVFGLILWVYWGIKRKKYELAFAFSSLFTTQCLIFRIYFIFSPHSHSI